MIDAQALKSRLGPDDYRKLFRRCGFDINGERGTELSGVLGPAELGEGSEGNFSLDLEKGLVKDWGSTGYKGDLYSVVQDVQGLNFTESLEWVVDELNLDPSTLEGEATNSKSDETPASSTEDPNAPQSPTSPETVVSGDQVDVWHERLMGDTEASRAARSYLIESRGVNEEVLQAARIGLAHSPDDGRATWWIMIPVPDREAEEPTSIVAVKGFAFAPSAGGWKRDAHGRKIPRNAGSAALYDLVPSGVESSLIKGPVLVTEGEMDALCALSHGFNAVTGTSGAGTFKPDWATYITDLAPARENGIIVAFDGDEQGRSGAKKAASLLQDAGADVRVASFPEGKDVSDVLMWGGQEALRHFLDTACSYPRSEDGQTDVRDAEEESSDPSYEPFPMKALPAPVRAYVRAASEALPAPPVMVAVPTLSVLSSAIGDAARLELKRSWTEPATLWTVLVAPSGSTKSPAFDHAVRPVFHRESEALEEHEKALAEWKAQENPDERDRPSRDRYRTGDATPEAIVKILEENPRGVLLARDELGAWIGSFDRYVNGAADLQFWVEIWQGVQASRDRAGEGNTTVDTPAVPVTGTIQPGTLKEKLDDIHFDTGFAARLILCKPPPKPKRWTEADVSRDVREAYERLLTRLYNAPSGQRVSLSSKAKDTWIEYYNDANASLEARPEGPIKAMAAKGITHTARLALVLHLSRKASGEVQSQEVDLQSMKNALRLGKWLTSETHRVYCELGLENESLSTTQRFLQCLPDQFKTATAKNVAEEEGIPERTCEKWLSELVDSSDLEKIKRGLYRKP